MIQLRFQSTMRQLVTVLVITIIFAIGSDRALAVDAAPTLAAAGQTGRVVSVGGAVTEILYALGLEDRIVGVDSTSLFPKRALGDKPNVGYMRRLSPEGLLGLNPQAIIAIEGSGPKETIAVLKAAKVPLVFVPEAFSESGITDKIRTVAQQMGVERRGSCLAGAVEEDLAVIRKMRAQVTAPARVMFVMSIVGGRAMVAGRNTGADAIIALSGGVNAIDGYDGYKQINEEAIVAAKPDVVLAMERGADSVTADSVFSQPAFGLTPASKDKAFISMNGLYLLGFGPRTAAAAHDLAGKLYPQLKPVADNWVPRASTADCRN